MSIVNGHDLSPSVMSQIWECSKCLLYFTDRDVKTTRLPQCKAPNQSVAMHANPYFSPLFGPALDNDTTEPLEKPKVLPPNTCPDCERELCWMDTYYGDDQFVAARCQPCREKRGQRRSA